MENIGTLAQTIDRVSELLRQQKEISKETADVGKDNIGKKPEEMKPEDRDRLNKNADAQAKLAEKTQQAMASMNKTAEQLEKADPSAAEAMKNAAQTGQQQQVQQNQQKAASQAKQNQQAQAQGAEAGRAWLADDAESTQRSREAKASRSCPNNWRSCKSRSRISSAARPGIISITSRSRARTSLPRWMRIRSQLFEYSARDEKATLNADLPSLSAGQELTERNARDIGKTADAVPNAGDVASQIIRAADKMERAIVYLRQSKLPDAYDPPQTDALAALLNAQKRIATMKQNVDQQINNEQKEAIRQQYIEIKQEQDKLNTDTTKIETARGADGGLPRIDAVRLGQLPGEQGKLADRVDKLAKDLTDADSIVYLWANNDIATSMKSVKDDLGKQQTNIATQTEQKRIADQLQAMIDNLVEHHDQSKFAQDQGGGGQGSGGGGKPHNRLPSEAELRLTQALQKAINASTKVLNEQKDKDKPKLLALGNRQSDLRNVLGQLLDKSSQGQIKFGPEPDNRDQLPEEANQEQVENQELDQQLLNDKPMDDDQTDKQVNLVGDHMGRVHQRLAMNDDPGKTTQIIEDRIITDMDILIDQSRKQEAQTRNSPPKPGQQQDAQAKPSRAAGAAIGPAGAEHSLE